MAVEWQPWMRKREWTFKLPPDWTEERYRAALVALLNGPCVGDAATLAAAIGGAEIADT